MSIISSVVLYLLCLIILSFSTSIAAGRHIGVVNKVPGKITLLNSTKSLASMEIQTNSIDVKSKSNNGALLSNLLEAKVKVLKNTNLASKDIHNALDDVNVVNPKGRRSYGGGKITKNIKSKKFSKEVSWGVPKKRRGVPETGFNLDYAPPKVHPPTHN